MEEGPRSTTITKVLSWCCRTRPELSAILWLVRKSLGSAGGTVEVWMKGQNVRITMNDEPLRLDKNGLLIPSEIEHRPRSIWSLSDGVSRLEITVSELLLLDLPSISTNRRGHVLFVNRHTALMQRSPLRVDEVSRSCLKTALSSLCGNRLETPDEVEIAEKVEKARRATAAQLYQPSFMDQAELMRLLIRDRPEDAYYVHSVYLSTVFDPWKEYYTGKIYTSLTTPVFSRGEVEKILREEGATERGVVGIKGSE